MADTSKVTLEATYEGKNIVAHNADEFVKDNFKATEVDSYVMSGAVLNVVTVDASGRKHIEAFTAVRAEKEEEKVEADTKPVKPTTTATQADKK